MDIVEICLIGEMMLVSGCLFLILYGLNNLEPLLFAVDSPEKWIVTK